MSNPAARITDLSVAFSGRTVLRNVSLDAPRGITVLVGRSGSGKTTLLRSLNRLNEIFPGYRGKGCVKLDLGNGLQNIYPGCGEKVNFPITSIRRMAGMVFQTPDVLPVSILANIMLPLRYVAGMNRQGARKKACEALQSVALWPEVKDRLDMPAARLSGGQQQRLCLARALALEPALLLLDEPTASLDTASASAIEELLRQIASSTPLIMVSHNPGQACALAGRLALMADGEVKKVFDSPIPTPDKLAEMLGED